ncbi:MAG: hypothetical protein IPO93_16120 [Actinobacteria bacterium]|nr:hypothetical protein [Actinomycetota bacterium]
MRTTTVVGGWRAPALHPGANVIALPRLSSGARTQVTVACSPSSACQVSGDELVIDASAVSVTVTWWAPARGSYRAWGTSRGL